MISYEEFKKKVVDSFMDFMTEEYRNRKLVTVPVKKVNLQLDGICLKIDHRKKSDITPTLYINDMYADYLESMDFNLVMEKYADRMATGIEFGKRILPMITYENNMSMIVFQLINTKENIDFLKDTPHRELLDMSIIYRWMISGDSKGISSVIIHDDLARSMGVTEEELYEAAYENTRKILVPVVKNMGEVIEQMMSDTEQKFDYSEIGNERLDFVKSFIVITNCIGFLGAASIIYTDLIYDIAEEINKDVYIVPASINEVILIPAVDGIDENQIIEMIVDVNKTDVPASDKLSDSLYRFSRETKELSLVR